LLIVDDEPLVLRLLCEVLEPEWDVAPAASGEQAYRLVCSMPFEVVLCDIMMSGMTGMQLASLVEARDPSLRRSMVFMTGGAITGEAEEFLARADVTALDKPMNFSALRLLLRERSKMPAPLPA
jgi:CheY-like chemotaxis protein